ncbi:MAG: hypothetical protein AAFR28_03580 [Pseudomonadota bacterium]
MNEPEVEPEEGRASSRPWLSLIKDAEQSGAEYFERAENINKLYGRLSTMAAVRTDREFQIFWANLEVLRPSVYAHAPVPVVVPRFKDRRPLPRRAAQVLERALISDVETDDLDTTLKLVRDDMLRIGRGVVWLRVDERAGVPCVKAEFVQHRDFLHGEARYWHEVPWVARAFYYTLEEGLSRFKEASGMAFEGAKFEERRLGEGVGEDAGRNHGGRRTALVWELWHRGQNVVVWLTEGVDVLLDAEAPFLDLEGFFPCPRPAYSTLEPDTLRPIPDIAYYRDQVEEINELTARISGLAESLRVWGFVPDGEGDIGDAVEAALANDGGTRATITKVKDVRMFAAGGGGSLVEWFPVEQVASVVAQLVELRRQLIQDVYQITGLSDIMRGATEAAETATAQQLKSQYGSIRIRSHQEMMQRVARDVLRMKAEVIAEQFDSQTILLMSQVDDLPEKAQVVQQASQQGADVEQALANTVTIEAVMELYRSQRVRPFVLEVETDSTIQPNEDAEKQRRAELLAAIGGFAQQALPMVQAFPQAGKLVAELLKFAAGGFRASRELEGVFEDFGDQLEQIAQQPPAPDPAQQKAQQEAEMRQAEMQMRAEEGRANLELKRKEVGGRLQLDQQRAAAEMQLAAARAQAEAALKERVANDAVRRDDA